MGDKLKIMVADNSPLFAEGLKNLLKAEKFEFIGVAKDGQETYQMAVKENPGVILMDINILNIEGGSIVQKIKNNLDNINIIVIANFDKRDNLFKVIKAGASGYMFKYLLGEELLDSLTEINENQGFIFPQFEEFIKKTIR